MITIRKSEARGGADYGWLKTYHSFSFSSYYDPQYMGFRSLRVINEDRVAPTKGFATHSHRDMEIISYVVAGALEHKDSMGNSSVIVPGEVQRMSAGTGVSHSEYNPSDAAPVHLLQIWILPERGGMPPSYEQKKYEDSEKRGKLRLIGSRDGRGGSVTIYQDVDLYGSLLAPGEKIEYEIKPTRGVWLQLVKGELALNGQMLSAGDGAAVEGENQLSIAAKSEAEFLLFDLA